MVSVSDEVSMSTLHHVEATWFSAVRWYVCVPYLASAMIEVNISSEGTMKAAFCDTIEVALMTTVSEESN